jgi:hypothetical protein
MNASFITGSEFYKRLKKINERVFGVVSVLVYSVLYLIVVPFVLLFAGKKISSRVSSGWQPWLLRADTLDDVRKQY